MRLLIVDDETALTNVLSKKLSPEFQVDVANDGQRGSLLACTNEYDLAILDHHLPYRLGSEICSDIRRKGKTYPILMLSVESDARHKAELLNLGADDYLSKPFSFVELNARIKAMLRRPKPIQGTELTFDDLILNPATHQTRRGKKEIHLTKKEFMLLEYFMRHPGLVLTRGTLMEHVWDMNGDVFSNTIEMHILNLRRKLRCRGKPDVIQTITGCGYKLAVKKYYD